MRRRRSISRPEPRVHNRLSGAGRGGRLGGLPCLIARGPVLGARHVDQHARGSETQIRFGLRWHCAMGLLISSRVWLNRLLNRGWPDCALRHDHLARFILAHCWAMHPTGVESGNGRPQMILRGRVKLEDLISGSWRAGL